MIIDIELRTIRFMLAIEETGSFAKAAKVLFISQPALTQYIQRIEAQLSYPLYIREKGKCYPTESAKILLVEGKVILDKYNDMVSKMNKIANPINDDILLGWPMGYTVPYTRRVKPQNQQIKPTNVVITEDTVENLITLLLEKKLNILLLPALYSNPNLHYITVKREEFYLAVPKEHGANKIIENDNLSGFADLSKLSNMPFISLYAPAYKEFIKPLFYEAGYKPNVVFKCNSWDSSHSLVEDCLGLAIVPFWFADQGHEKVNYYRIKSNEPTYRILTLAYHKKQVITDEFQNFIDGIIEDLGDEYSKKPFDYSVLNKTI